jgi:hypothetical protein
MNNNRKCARNYLLISNKVNENENSEIMDIINVNIREKN